MMSVTRQSNGVNISVALNPNKPLIDRELWKQKSRQLQGLVSAQRNRRAACQREVSSTKKRNEKKRSWRTKSEESSVKTINNSSEEDMAKP